MVVIAVSGGNERFSVRPFVCPSVCPLVRPRAPCRQPGGAFLYEKTPAIKQLTLKMSIAPQCRCSRKVQLSVERAR